MTILDQLRILFRGTIASIYSIDADPLLVPTGNPQFGDYQCNAAMALAKQTKNKPRDVAEAIKTAVTANRSTLIDRLEIAGPGFINVFLSKSWLETQLAEVSADQRLGVAKVTQPQTIVVDYCGVNIAKEMHVGHLRSTIIGDAIARVFDFQGQKTIRQNHLGDWGTQFGMLITALRYPPGATAAVSVDSTEAFDIKDLDGFYQKARQRFDSDEQVNGHSFADEARDAVVRLQAGNADELAWWRRLVELSQAHFRPLYSRLQTSLSSANDAGESKYNPLLRPVVEELKAKGLAVDSEGAVGVFIDGEGKPPLIVEKSNGGFLYGTTDLAAIRYRVNELHASRIVYFTDSRQAQHFSQVFRTAKAAGWAEGVALEHAPFGTILGKDGKPFKTRSGETVKLKDLLDEAEERAFNVVNARSPEMDEPQKKNIATAVGVGAVKYGDLSKDRTSDYVFDWDTMLALEGNTAPYLQYAHARVRSIFRKAGEGASGSAKFILDQPQELALAKHILRLGEVIDAVARELKPHLLCAYLYELATKFSAFFEHCPVLKSEEPIRASRLALTDLTGRTIVVGLELLGISHPDAM